LENIFESLEPSFFNLTKPNAIKLAKKNHSTDCDATLLNLKRTFELMEARGQITTDQTGDYRGYYIPRRRLDFIDI